MNRRAALDRKEVLEQKDGEGWFDVSFRVKGDAIESMMRILQQCETVGGFGHSFGIVVDPDDSEYENHVGFDGDGSDVLADIKVNGKSVKPKCFLDNLKERGAISSIVHRVAHHQFIQASTHSLVGVLLKSGRVNWIYVHFDGMDHLATLRRYYNSQQEAMNLIKMGDLRTITPEEEDLEPYGKGPSLAIDYDSFIGAMSVSYYYLFVNGKWHEVRQGLPGRDTKPDMNQSFQIDADDSLRRGLGVGRAKSVFDITLIMQERGSNKFHYFAVYEVSPGEFIGGNAYGGIGKSAKAVLIAEGKSDDVFRKINRKISDKKRKGYWEYRR